MQCICDYSHVIVEFRSNVAHTARVYDFWLGGKDNYPADRQAGLQAEEVFPTVRHCARQNREFMRRATRTLARELGIRQFLDIGTGLPTEPNLHQAVQEVHADARVVYVDNDDLVLAHARALMAGTPEGRTAYIPGDLRKPEEILSASAFRDTIDMSQPVAVTLIAVLHFIEDPFHPYEIVKTLMSEMPAGSVLALTHATPDFGPHMAAVQDIYHASGMPGRIRTRAEILPFFDGLEMLEPGLTTPHGWRPEGTEPPESWDEQVQFYAGVAVKR